MSTTYSWDPAGHLTGIAAPGVTSAYEYGVTGMREKATRTTPAGTTWTKSAWDGQTLLAEEDSDGTRYRYLFGPGGIPLALEVTPLGGAAAVYSYHTDAQGSVVALTGASGTLVASYAYDPFGRPTLTGGSDPSLANRQPLPYRGCYYDTGSGLYCLPARCYDREPRGSSRPTPHRRPHATPPRARLHARQRRHPVRLRDARA
jgi:uncharacterized protein RhaS with RHS repeats